MGLFKKDTKQIDTKQIESVKPTQAANPPATKGQASTAKVPTAPTLVRSTGPAAGTAKVNQGQSAKPLVGQATMVLKLTDKIEFENRLRKITNRIHCAPNIDAILIDLKDDILGLTQAERMTIYAVTEDEQEIYSKVKVGEDIKEFRVAINNTSIAGYVANNKTMLAIKDAYDLKELEKVDTRLNFNREYDQRSGFRTKQVLAVPIIFNEKLMGVVQIINKRNGEAFLDSDARAILDISETLAIAFYNKQKLQKKELNRYDLLISENLILPMEIEQAVLMAREANISIEQVLIEKFKVKKADVGRALSHFYKVPFFEFKPGISIPSNILKQVDAGYLRKSVWVPVKEEDETIYIAIDNPRSLEKIDDIKRQLPSQNLRFLVALADDINKTMDYFLGAEKAPPKEPEKKQDNLKDIVSELKEDENPSETLESDTVEEVSESDSAVIRAVNQIITDANKMGASDIHIEPSSGKKEVIVRVRVDGVCSIMQTLPYSTKRAVISRIKIMAGMDIAERRKPQDGKIQFKKYGGTDIELRVAIIPTAGGHEDAVLRILAASKPIPLDNMAMSERNISEFKKMLDMPYGIVLVVGPTGSGKTTTLHSGLGFINTPDMKIWTAEDPVEITQEGLRQVQVAPKIGFTFAAAMRAFLRADPDVIMVGEMRDHETAAIGIEASLTGHLVFSTLHTNSAPETIIRLLDMGIDPFNFADALIGVLAQRLSRRLCKECKQAYHPEEEEYAYLVHEYDSKLFERTKISYNEDMMLYQTKGCNTCKMTGYKGRLGIHELLVASDTIKRMIQQKATAEALRDKSIEEGMTTLKQDGIVKVFKGITDLKEIRSVCIK